MLKCILRSRNENAIINLVRMIRYKTNSTLIDQNENKIKISTSKSTKTDVKSTSSSQLNIINLNSRTITPVFIDDRVKGSENIIQLFNNLRQCVNQLSSEHLAIVFGRIFQLSVLYRNQSNKGNSNRIWTEFIKTVNSSVVFEGLILRMIELDGKLCCDALLNAFLTFERLNIDPNGKEVKVVIKNLQQILYKLKFNQILQFLDTYQSYSRQKYFPDGLYSSLYKALIQVAKENIMSNEIDRNDVPVLIKALKIFLRDTNFSIVDKVSELLLLPENHLDLKKSCKLLNILKAISKERHKEFALFDKFKLNRLIEKCNKSIYEHLRSDSNDVWFYLRKLHQVRINAETSKNLQNIYPVDMLDIVVPVLLQDKRNEYLIHNFAENYAISHKFDERIIRHINHSYSTNEHLRKRLGISQLTLLTDLRLPFVDAEKLIEILFNNNYEQILNTISNNSSFGLQLINTFILNDFNNGHNLEICLRCFKEKMKKSALRKLSYQTFKEFCLSRVYFSHFGKVEFPFEKKITEKLGEIFQLVLEVYKTKNVDDQSIKMNGKLNKGHLSNGLFLENWAIFQLSTYSFVKPTDFDNYFHMIDKLPLKEDQELLAIIMTPRLEGNIDKKYELNTNYQLRRVLNKLKIKSINVVKEDFISLSDEEKESYLIENHINSS